MNNTLDNTGLGRALGAETAEYDVLPDGLYDVEEPAAATAGDDAHLAEIDLRSGVAGPPAEEAFDVDAIVLDIDDTLYLERDYVRSGFEAVDRWARHELGIEDFGERAWATFEAGHRNTIFDEVLAACGQRVSDALVTELVARYRTHSPSISLAPDAQAALERWHNAVDLAAVTDGPESSQRAKTRALGLDAWMSPLIFTASLGPGMGKPHPASFEMVQESLGVEGKRCVYVADNPAKDFAGPKSLGWRTVRVRRPLALHADAVNGDDVDHEVTSFDQIDELLAG